MGQRALAVMLLVMPTLILSTLAASAKTKSKSRIKRTTLNSRLLMLNRKQKSTRSQLHEKKSEQRDVIDTLREMQDRIQETTDNIARIQGRLRKTKLELIETQSRLNETRAQRDRDRQRLAARMVADRRSDSSTYVALLIGAKDMNDFMDREHFVRKIVQSDVTLIRDLNEKESQIRSDESLLNDKKKLQTRLVYDLDVQKQNQKEALYRQRAVYYTLQRERSQLEQVLAQQEQDSENVRRMLLEMEGTPEGHSRAAIPWTGSFVRPVNGPITSGFGMRYHPILHVRKLHTGVDFGVPIGTPVHAAASGVVVHAGWLGAYGNAVIIDHGGGVSTLYGHNSHVDVHAGESVSAGQVISHSGSTGYSTGPHVHFEKRVDGKPVPPF
jgi:murein DD-endopeptidase MepM/ murein hydrolase activator NlpD